MKVLTSDEIRALDQYTIVNEPVLSIDLMERAAKGIKRWLEQNINMDLAFHLFCGTGNNGGDGLALARLLKKDGINVHIHLVNLSKNMSLDASTNEKKLDGLVRINHIITEVDFPEINEGAVVIDCLFGSGLNRSISGIAEDIIHFINALQFPVISVDVPSGLFCNHPNPEGIIVEADITLSFQLPKLSFLVPENEDYIGQWTVLDIGLSPEGLEQAQSTYNYILPNEVAQIPQPPSKFAHKGHNGHALLLAGSKGKPGAGILAAKAALRSGVGLVTAVIPSCNYSIFHTAIPEAMSFVSGEIGIESHPELDNFHAIAIGPGIGLSEQSVQVLASLLERVKQPLILDADAITLLSIQKDLIDKLPRNTILTPHIGEFDRLVGPSANSFERLEKLLDFSINHQCLVVLKGAHSAIATPDGQVYFNSTGNPGLATAGTGDTLTGVLLSLIAQGYHPLDASILGVYWHGAAGDLALEEECYESLLASDIIKNLGKSFKSIVNPGS